MCAASTFFHVGLVTGDDQTLRIWDLSTRTASATLTHPDAGSVVAISPDGMTAVSTIHSMALCNECEQLRVTCLQSCCLVLVPQLAATRHAPDAYQVAGHVQAIKLLCQ